jgi:hypothetical protein
MILQVKKAVEKLPASLSKWVYLVPFRFRLGSAYTKTQFNILLFGELVAYTQKVESIKSITE